MSDRDLGVEFASGRQKFDPSEWEPSRYLASGRGHKKGETCFRRKGHPREVLKTLPPGHVVEQGRVYREGEAPSVTVGPPPVGLPARLDYLNFYPRTVVRGLPTSSLTDRKVRLALLALAEHHAAREWRQLPRGVRDYAREYADRDSEIGWPAPDKVGRKAFGNAWRNSSAVVGNGRHYLMHSLFVPPGVSGRRTDSAPAALREALAGASPDDRRPESHLLRSVFLSHPRPVTIPLSRQIRDLATVAYRDSDRVAMKVLADALEETGKTPEVALDALRDPHSAVRGNWVLDAILGKRP